MYRHVIIHAQCQQVAHRHSKTWKTWHKGRQRAGKMVAFQGGNITEKLLPVLDTLAGHLERNKGNENTQGQIRLHYNTHAGQEESTVSLAQKSMYGCNFIIFIYFHLRPLHIYIFSIPFPFVGILNLLNVTLAIQNDSGHLFFFNPSSRYFCSSCTRALSIFPSLLSLI